MTIPPARSTARAVVNVGIAESALTEGSADAALHRAIHEDLLEDLATHGQLVFTSNDELLRFLAAVRGLPTNLAKAWEAVLSSRRVNVSVADPQTTPDLSEVLDPLDLEQRLADRVQLVLLESDHAQLLGVGADDYSVPTPGGLVEIGRLATANRTATILAARQVMDAPLREGGNREDEWTERLEPLADAASPIVIYDKYVGAQTARRYIYGRQAGDGLTWLLHRISMRPGRKVRVITAVPYDRRGPEPIDETVLAAGFLAAQSHIGRDFAFDVVLVPERQVGNRTGAIERFGHDRHLRFGARAVLALGLGVQSFAEPRFRETITVARLPIADAKGREERAIKAALRPPQGGWLQWARIQAARSLP